LHVSGAQRVAGGLQGRGIDTRQKAIVEALERHALSVQALLHPLVPVQTQLHGIGDVGANLQKGGAPVSIVDVEIEMFDGHRLPGEVEDHTSCRGVAFVGFEGAHLFLRGPDDDDPLAAGEPRAVARDDVIFPLTGLECHGGNAVSAGERVDRRQEAVQHRPEQGGRGDRIPQVIVEEVAQTTGRLELGHVGMQVEPVDTADGERHVLADNIGDVGRHQTLLGGMVDDGTARRTPVIASVPTSSPVKLRLNQRPRLFPRRFEA
jgi:hypothetical protein